MAATSTPISTRRFDFLAAIYRLQNLSQLMQTILSELPGLVPGDNVMIGNHDATRRVMGGIILKQPFSRMHFLPEANETGLLAHHPFWSVILDPHEPLKILSEMTRPSEWQENPFYRELLHEDRVRDHINIEFGEGPSCFTTVGVIRSRVGFSDEERTTLRLIRPHLIQAFSNASIAETAGFCSPLGESLAGTADISMRGGWLNATSREKFLRLIGQGKNQGPVIKRVAAWLRSEIDGLNRGLANGSSEGWTILVGGSILRCVLRRDYLNHRYRLIYWLSDELNQPIVVDLSRKEREVLFWVNEGKTNAEIALILKISCQTVKFHLKNIFRKLGVETRTAAARYFSNSQ